MCRLSRIQCITTAAGELLVLEEGAHALAVELMEEKVDLAAARNRLAGLVLKLSRAEAFLNQTEQSSTDRG